ncbi:helix-turn-helix domain-containing protein [Streptomyces sp. NPDC001508]|uniref:PucR family transcriptional regulator n=1 Tax=Streptomyces sp. NPDC001508 TaxID=3154656 RepID=UPI00332D027B
MQVFPGSPGGVPSESTLRHLLAHDESGILRLVVAPPAQDAALHGALIADEGTASSYDGRIVLATGVRPDAAAAADAVRDAARKGAAAVVLGGTADPAEPARAAAGEMGTALLARATWATWDDVLELVRSVLVLNDASGQDSLAQSAAGGGLVMLTATVARACQASITVEDTQFRVLAHSATSADADGLRQSTILGGRVPEWRVAELRRSGLVRALWTSHDVIHRPAQGDDPERLVIAIRSGGEVLGSIWAAADGGQLSPDAPQVLRRAAEVAVPYLLQERLRGSVEPRRREHALRGLLTGEGDPRSQLWTLGLSADTACAVVVAERDRRAGPDAEYSLQALGAQASVLRSTAHTWRDGPALIVLLPVMSGNERDVAGFARELDSLAAATPGAPPVWTGAGPLVPTPLDAADSYAEALLVVRALRDREARGLRSHRPVPVGADVDGRPPVRYAGPGETAQTVAVLRVLDAVRPVWERHGGPVHDMIAADLAAGGELVRSLAAYLDEAGDIPRAAQRLVLHPNTLRYRLRRIRERFGVDLDDPDTLLIVTLAVRLAASPSA